MGPLAGTKVIEMKGIGPGPYAGMLLADMGAEVIVVERSRKPSPTGLPSEHDAFSRGKKSIALNLKTEAGVEVLLKLIESADILFEGYRPGVAERLGFGPDICLARNPKLVYGRMTGWGQTGPLAHTAGHDINYIALSGALSAIGERDKPVPPLNLVGDFGGGSLFLVMGILAALNHAQRTGQGDVVDVAISDCTASLMTMMHTCDALGQWTTERQSNLLDGGMHFYNVYETADEKFISVGAIEPQFYALLMEKAELDPAIFADQFDTAKMPAMKQKMQEIFKTKTRDEWCEIMEDSDVCFAPVLDYKEAPEHPHNQARNTFMDINGVTQPSPVPRFQTNNLSVPDAPHAEGVDTESVLTDLGFSDGEIEALQKRGALAD